MSASLVEDNSAKAVLDSDRHLTCLAVSCAEIYKSGLCGRLTYLCGRDEVEHLKSHSATGSRAARLVLTLIGCNCADCYSCSCVRVANEESFAVSDEDLVLYAVEVTLNLRDKLTMLLSGKASSLKYVGLVTDLRGNGVDLYGVNIGDILSVQANGNRCVALCKRVCRRASTVKKSLTAHIRGRCIYGSLSEEHAYTNARKHVIGYSVDLSINEHYHVGARMLAEHFCEVAARRHSYAEDFFKQFFCNHFVSPSFVKLTVIYFLSFFSFLR